MLTQRTTRIEVAVDDVSRTILFCTSTPAFDWVLNCFLAGRSARDDLPTTNTGSQMIKDRFAPVRRE